MAPSSLPIDVACLQSVNLARLQSREPSEVSTLVKACQTNGFFYLNLEDGGQEFLRDWATALALVTEFYDEPLDVKLQYYRGEGMSG